MVKTILACVLLSTTIAAADVDPFDVIEVDHFAQPPPDEVVEPVAPVEPIVIDHPYTCVLPLTIEARHHSRDDVTNLLGFHIGLGRLPVGEARLQTTALGISVEHRVHGRWRMLGEYEYLWIGTRDREPDKTTVMDGSAHRVQVGLRRSVLESRLMLDHTLRFYLDGELGGGVLLGSEPMAGTIVQPHAFAGVRLGYTFMNMRNDTRASIAWEPEVIVRAFAVEEGYGGMLAIGMTWGD